jgi:hypothetical protein
VVPQSLAAPRIDGGKTTLVLPPLSFTVLTTRK